MVFEKIKNILAEQLGADENEMTMDTDIANDLKADSLDVVELLMSIEDEFDVEIPDESEYAEKDRNMVIGVRLSDYERIIDFLCNFFKFSVNSLTLERIKKLVGLNNYFQWGSLVPTNSQPNSKGLAELVVLSRQGTDAISVSVINGGITTAAKTIVQINSTLKQVTDLQNGEQVQRAEHYLTKMMAQ